MDFIFIIIYKNRIEYRAGPFTGSCPSDDCRASDLAYVLGMFPAAKAEIRDERGRL